MTKKNRSGKPLKLKKKTIRSLAGSELARAKGGTFSGNFSGEASNFSNEGPTEDCYQSDDCGGSLPRGTGANHNQGLRS